jgi:hypothetical protein
MCVPTTCREGSSTCGGGRECRSQGLCIARSREPAEIGPACEADGTCPGGGTCRSGICASRDPRVLCEPESRCVLSWTRIAEVLGTCEADGSCARGRCETATRCIPPAATP